MPVVCNFFLRPVLNGVLFFALIAANAGVLAAESAGGETRPLTERQVDERAELYISAVEDRDFDLWYELLSPLHPAAAELNEDYFLEQVGSVESLSVQEVDGGNVLLRIRYASGDRRESSLQMDPAGRIKYTPFCFKHPLYEIAAQLELLLNDQVTIMGATSSPATRAKAAYILGEMGVPLFGYDPYSTDPNERLEAAKKILKWLGENGQLYDKGEPECPLPPDDLDALVSRLQKASQ